MGRGGGEREEGEQAGARPQGAPTSVVPDSEVGVRPQRTLEGHSAAIANFVSVQGPDDLDELEEEESCTDQGEEGLAPTLTLASHLAWGCRVTHKGIVGLSELGGIVILIQGLYGHFHAGGLGRAI